MSLLWVRPLLDLSPSPAIMGKVTFLLVLGWAFHFALRRANPGWTVLLWRGIAVAVMLVPFLVVLSPPISVPIVVPTRTTPAPAEPVEAAVRVLPPALDSQVTPKSSLRDGEPSPPPLVSAASARPSWSLIDWVREHPACLLATLWALVAAVLTVFAGRCWMRSKELLMNACPAPKSARELLRNVARGLGYDTSVSIRSSARVACPVLIGVRRPVIVLPQGMMAQRARDDLPAVLAHELAHVKSRDLLWSRFIQALSVILWFHPLVWAMRRAHAAACEKVCDGVAAHYVGDTAAYSGTLARVALALVGARSVVDGIPMARKSEVRVRLEFLKQKIFATPPRRRWVALFVSLGVVVLAIVGGLRLVRAEVRDSESAEAKLTQQEGEFISQHLNNPDFPGILRDMTSRARTTRIPPLTKGAIAILRRQLKEEPGPGIALTLARIIQDQFSTQLEFYAPTGYYQGGTFWWRQDPNENYQTMAEVLSIGFDHAEKGTDLWRELGCALAKLRLIQGDWNAMNRVLIRLGMNPIPKSRPSFLTAPPGTWLVDPDVEWTLCDESMRSGSSGLVMEFAKDGRPLQGMHVCIRDWNNSPGLAPTEVITSAPPADPHGFAPYPLPCSWSDWARANRTFGDLGPDNDKTRYAVSDQRGMVEFEKLPAIPVQIEVFISTANFTEPARGWTIELESVPPEQSEDFTGPPGDVITGGPVVNLRPGRTVHYPRMTVYRLVDLNVVDWTDVKAADLDSFVLTWPDQSTMWTGEVQYEVEMGLYEGGERPTVAPNYRYMTEVTKQRVTINRLEVGAHGVGGRKPSPGRTYGFQVTAYDRDGKVIGRPEIRRVRFLHHRPERTLLFPYDRSLGTLKTREWGKYDSFDVGWTTLGEASEEVYIPEGLELRLDVTEEGAKDLTALIDLQPDAFEMLVLSDTSADDNALSCITHLTGLQSLRLASTQITDKKTCDLRLLGSLRELDLSGTGIGDYVPEYCLKSLTNLCSLNVMDTTVSPTGVAWMMHHVRECEVTHPHPQSEVDNAYIVVEMDRRPREGRTDWEDLPGEKMVGVVRAPNGSPLSGAEVVISSNRATAGLENGKVGCISCPKAVTDGSGEFVLPWPGREGYWFNLVAWHDLGIDTAWYKDITPGKPVEFTLEPWSRIEGTYYVGSRPAANRKIIVQMRHDVAYLDDRPEATTDGDGHFVFERLRPGGVIVSEPHTIMLGPCIGLGLYEYRVDLDLQPGGTRHVVLGGVGRPVVGQVVLSGEADEKKDWSGLTGECRLELKDSGVPYPDGLDEQEKAEWLEQWKRSSEGKAFRLAQVRCGKSPLGEKGMFRIDDVPPGSYRLTVIVYGQFSDEECEMIQRVSYPIAPPEVGSVSVEFTMAEVPDGQSDEPLDLGTLNI